MTEAEEENWHFIGRNTGQQGHGCWRSCWGRRVPMEFVSGKLNVSSSAVKLLEGTGRSGICQACGVRESVQERMKSGKKEQGKS